MAALFQTGGDYPQDAVFLGKLQRQVPIQIRREGRNFTGGRWRSAGAQELPFAIEGLCSEWRECRQRLLLQRCLPVYTGKTAADRSGSFEALPLKIGVRSSNGNISRSSGG